MMNLIIAQIAQKSFYFQDKIINKVEFATEEPIETYNLTQCFTKPHPLAVIIYEFIERKNKGFNVDNVKTPIISTKDIK
jgi:hypothetical protein